MEKNIDPTPKRINDLAKKGELPRSKVVGKLIPFTFSSVALFVTLDIRGASFSQFSAGCLQGHCDDYSLVLFNSIVIVGAVTVSNLIGGLLYDFWCSQGRLGKEREGMSFASLNFVNGFKSLGDHLKNWPFYMMNVFLYCIALGWVAYGRLQSRLESMVVSSDWQPTDLISDLRFVLLWGGGLGIVFGVIDYLWEKFKFLKKNRMSWQDLKEEFKNDEGDPHIKGERRAIHEEIMLSNLEERVKKSQFIVIERKPC
jgi:flagellar biosynthesis protein FlhB